MEAKFLHSVHSFFNFFLNFNLRQIRSCATGFARVIMGPTNAGALISPKTQNPQATSRHAFLVMYRPFAKQHPCPSPSRSRTSTPDASGLGLSGFPIRNREPQGLLHDRRSCAGLRA